MVAAPADFVALAAAPVLDPVTEAEAVAEVEEAEA